MLYRNILRLKETPIILGLLLAFIIWSAKHIVDRVNETPLVEYSLSWLNDKEYLEWKRKYHTDVVDCRTKSPLKNNKYNYLEITMQNLSSKALLENLELGFALNPTLKTNIKGVELLSKVPAFRKDSIIFCDNKSINIKKIDFHPKWEYKLIIALNGFDEPKGILLHSSQAIILERENFRTWVSKNEICILSTFLIISLGMTITYFVLLSYTNNSKD